MSLQNMNRTLLSAMAALCIASSFAVTLTGCDKINEWRNSGSRRPDRSDQGRGSERGVLVERGNQIAKEPPRVNSRNISGSNNPIANDIAARSIVFIPGPASDSSGVLKATFDNTFALSADIAIVISVDGIVVANGVTVVPAQSRWTYSASHTFTSAGDHALRMGAYLKGGMPIPEADMANNEAFSIVSLTQGEVARSQSAAANLSNKQPQGTTPLSRDMDLNDIEARSIGFMPDGSVRYASRAVAGEPGVIRTTFFNGFNYDANVRVNIIDGENMLSDVILLVPSRSQGAYLLKQTFDRPGTHKMMLKVCQVESGLQERDSLNNEMTTIIDVVPSQESGIADSNYAPNDIIVRSIAFQPDGFGEAANFFETGTVGRIKLNYTSTFMAKKDLAISWLIDGNIIDETSVKGVLFGEHYSLMGYTFDSIGKHAIGAEIKLLGDDNDEEADINNNKMDAVIEVIPVQEESRVIESVTTQSKQQNVGFSLVQPLSQKSGALSGTRGAAGQFFPDGSAPAAAANVPARQTYDLVSEYIIFMAAPGNEPVNSASVGQEGSIAYVVKNKHGAAKDVEVKISMELEGKAKYSFTKKINIPDIGVFEGTTDNIVLSQPGAYTLYLSADNPNNSNSSRSGQYFELKRALDVHDAVER